MEANGIASDFFDTKWAITPDAMTRLVRDVNRGHRMTKVEMDALVADKEAKAKAIRPATGRVARINIFGAVSQYASWWGTSTETIGREFDSLIADQSVGAIVLNIDSPGGSVYGVRMLADKIFAARGIKPVYAIANSLAASALYWIGSAAEQFYVVPGGEVGSIGVLALHVDWSKYNEELGVKPTYVFAGKYKVEGNPDEPLSDEARGAIQESVNQYYEDFVAAVARNREVKVADVKKAFGEGRCLKDEFAVKANMVDKVATLDEVLVKLVASSPGKRAEEQRIPVASMIAKRKAGCSEI